MSNVILGTFASVRCCAEKTLLHGFLFYLHFFENYIS